MLFAVLSQVLCDMKNMHICSSLLVPPCVLAGRVFLFHPCIVVSIMLEPELISRQLYVTCCCKLAVKELKMYADLTSFATLMSSCRYWDAKSRAWQLKLSCTSGSNTTFVSMSPLPTSTTTLVIATSMTSLVDVSQGGTCKRSDSAVINWRSLSVLHWLFCAIMTKWER